MKDCLLGLIIAIGIAGPLFYLSITWCIHQENEKNKTCQEYWHCQEVGNCSFIFDYDDVKDCDCGE